MAAVVQWARAQGKYISVFVAKHDVEPGKQLSRQDLCNLFRHGDDPPLMTHGLFFYAQGMPVVVTKNQFTGLKLVNGAPFNAVEVIPDLSASATAIADDETLHLAPPGAIRLHLEAIADLAVPGLPQVTLLARRRQLQSPRPCVARLTGREVSRASGG